MSTRALFDFVTHPALAKDDVDDYLVKAQEIVKAQLAKGALTNQELVDEEVCASPTGKCTPARTPT